MSRLTHEQSILREELRSRVQLLRENGMTYADIAVALQQPEGSIQFLLYPHRMAKIYKGNRRETEDDELKARLIAIAAYEMPGCDGSMIPTDDTAIAAAIRDCYGSTPRSSDDRTWRDEPEAEEPWVPTNRYLEQLSKWAAFVRRERQRNVDAGFTKFQKAVIHRKGEPTHPAHHDFVDWGNEW